jgi:transcriptional regulator with XRE-family HTH domain
MNYSYLIYKVRNVLLEQTQAEFAKAMKKEKSIISGWETGHKTPSRESLEEVAQIAKMPLPILLLYGMDEAKVVPMLRNYLNEQNIKL